MASIPFGWVKGWTQFFVFVMSPKPNWPLTLSFIRHQSGQPSHPDRRKWLWFTSHLATSPTDLRSLTKLLDTKRPGLAREFSRIVHLNYYKDNKSLSSGKHKTIYLLGFLRYISRNVCRYLGSDSTVIQMWCANAKRCLCLSVGILRCSPWENQWFTVVSEQSQINAISSRDTSQWLRNSSSSMRSVCEGWRYVSNALQCRWDGRSGAIGISIRIVIAASLSYYASTILDRAYYFYWRQ